MHFGEKLKSLKTSIERKKSTHRQADSKNASRKLRRGVKASGMAWMGDPDAGTWESEDDADSKGYM